MGREKNQRTIRQLVSLYACKLVNVKCVDLTLSFSPHKDQIIEIDKEIHRYIETSMMMGAAESAFSEWLDAEEDIYREDVQ